MSKTKGDDADDFSKSAGFRTKKRKKNTKSAINRKMRREKKYKDGATGFADRAGLKKSRRAAEKKELKAQKRLEKQAEIRARREKLARAKKKRKMLEEERKMNGTNKEDLPSQKDVEEDEDLYMPVDNEKDFIAADAEFFQDHSEFASFLQNMDLPEHNEKKKNSKKPQKQDIRDDTDDLEDYEKRPRVVPESWIEQSKSDTKPSRLPVKRLDGTVVAVKSPIPSSTPTLEISKSEISEIQGNKEDEQDQQNQRTQQAQRTEQTQRTKQSIEQEEEEEEEEDSEDEQAKMILRTRYIRQLKLRIADVCCSIVENPDHAVRSRGGKASKLQELHQLAATKDETAKCLVVLSQLRVFVDILPGYYIRPLTNAEKRTIVSKDVKYARSSENALLLAYQIYLRRLSKMIRDENNPEYRRVAAKCLGTLLLERPQFNYWESIIATLVPIADESSNKNKIARMTCDMFEKMLKSDLNGLSTLEYLKNVTKRLKQRNCELSLDLLATLRHCKVNAALSKQKRARLKKKRKRMRHDEIAQALAEAEATEQKQDVVIRRADALRDLVLIYFRILRSKKKSNTRKKIILPEAMGGLRRISHFLNFDVARELLQLLSELVNEEKMPLGCTMELVLTAMRTAAGYGAEMRFDMNPFVEGLRKSLRWIHLPRHCEGTESCVETAMYSVSSAFLKRREADKRRVTLCAIELLSGSLQMPPNACLASLATCRDLIQRYAGTLKTSLLAPPEIAREELGVLTHANDALILDTSSSSLEASLGDDAQRFSRGCETAWELALLGSHYHPYVSKFARDTASGALPHPSRTAATMLTRYDTSKGGFNPPIPGKPLKKSSYNNVEIRSSQFEEVRKISNADFRPIMTS